MKHIAWMGMFSGLLLAVGCGSPASSVGSCSVTGQGSATSYTFCIDYSGTSVTADIVRTSCTASSSATYSSTACSATNRLGRCRLTLSTDALVQTASYYPPMTAAEAQTACSAVGTWIAN